MRDREKLIDKIKKCLRLSKSSNEHEAAAALRQAKKLMEELQLSEADIEAMEACESRVKSCASQRPSKWELNLADMIAKSCGCHLIFAAEWRARANWLFIGCNGRDQVAAFAFIALKRQLGSQRSDYIKSKLRRCGPANKTARADTFCMGWIATVRAKVELMVVAESDSRAIALFADRYVTRSEKAIDRKPKGTNADNDWWNGNTAGRNTDLRRPMHGDRAAPQPIASGAQGSLL